MVYNFFYRKSASGGIKNENMSDQQLPEKLRKLIIRKFKTPRVHSSFINTI